jgi:hypothetical protein
MTAKKLREKALNKYKVGDTFNVKVVNGTGKEIGKIEAKIIKFFPHHALCKLHNYHETFTYHDLLTRLSKKKSKSKKTYNGISWDNSFSDWNTTIWN